MLHELSTPRFRRAYPTDNRSMNSTSTPGGLGRFLTLADVAEILNVSPSQAYTLVRSGELPAIKVGGGGRWRVERAVLEAWIEAKYEEARRHRLWQQADFTAIPELSIPSSSPESHPRG